MRYGIYVDTDCGKFYIEEEDGCIVRLKRPEKIDIARNSRAEFAPEEAGLLQKATG